MLANTVTYAHTIKIKKKINQNPPYMNERERKRTSDNQHSSRDDLSIYTNKREKVAYSYTFSYIALIEY